ncbi:NUDIX hydrolase [Planosporangium thailandense]|uniref:NUDIX hydrolase n=1 Tax=Planosporangium thailandense TaxID=765197 RepID=A0ABX0XTM1_9ACTN|nr:NUDIX hydrolase [Planosporangium thailandense]NJC68584.1 NUDIX hydrolase [Planosporangium thailandense]
MTTHRPGEDAYLAAYDAGAFPPFALTVDLNIFTIRDGVLTALLIERGDHPFKGFWALPGGHVEHGRESADEAAVRELSEETGLDWTRLGGHLEQVATYTDPDRDPRIRAGLHVASVAYVALAPNLPSPTAGTDAARARFWPVEDLDLDAQRAAWHDRRAYRGDAPALAYDHALILSDALERVRAKLEYSTLAAQFVTEPFTLADLRRVYQAVWGYAPDLANFRRKVLKTPGFVVPTEEYRPAASDRGGAPPLLYLRGTAQWINPPFVRDRAG